MFYIRGCEQALVVNGVSDPGNKTATETGASRDFSYTDDIVAVIQNIGTVSGTNPTWDGKLQQSIDGSTNWADCNVISALPVATATGAAIGTYQRDYQYVRYVGTLGGTSSPNFDVAATIMGQKKKI